jgi:hypothetical protein
MYAGQAQLSPAHVTTMACNGMGGPTIDIMDRPYLDIQTCHQHHTLKGAYDGSGFFESIHFGHCQTSSPPLVVSVSVFSVFSTFFP